MTQGIHVAQFKNLGDHLPALNSALGFYSSCHGNLGVEHVPSIFECWKYWTKKYQNSQNVFLLFLSFRWASSIYVALTSHSGLHMKQQLVFYTEQCMTPLLFTAHNFKVSQGTHSKYAWAFNSNHTKLLPNITELDIPSECLGMGSKNWFMHCVANWKRHLKRPISMNMIWMNESSAVLSILLWMPVTAWIYGYPWSSDMEIWFCHPSREGLTWYLNRWLGQWFCDHTYLVSLLFAILLSLHLAAFFYYLLIGYHGNLLY